MRSAGSSSSHAAKVSVRPCARMVGAHARRAFIGFAPALAAAPRADERQGEERDGAGEARWALPPRQRRRGHADEVACASDPPAELVAVIGRDVGQNGQRLGWLHVGKQVCTGMARLAVAIRWGVESWRQGLAPGTT
jgi:hypothetical protein